ncbi:ATP-dependent helicase [Erysipelotrichaceae bacterium AF15-26LB]|nr:SNF2-related protein [[Clostridium] innocuum]RJV83499.1 ATP-dependent helicase [Erysipelotrichaceae bacterium AF15-26LB]RJV84836.1 ATP-dependent helicase [Erysipelotrichaceae bacterium AF19-24AC]
MRLTVDDIKRQTKSETKLIKARKVQQENLIRKIYITKTQSEYHVEARMETLSGKFYATLQFTLNSESDVDYYFCSCKRTKICEHLLAVLYQIHDLQPEKFPFSYERKVEEQATIQAKSSASLPLPQLQQKDTSMRTRAREEFAERNAAPVKKKALQKEIVIEHQNIEAMVKENTRRRELMKQFAISSHILSESKVYYQELQNREHVEKVHLFVEAECSDQQHMYISLKIGDRKWYTVSSLTDFFERLARQSYAQYGMSLAFTHSISRFDEDSQDLIKFLKNCFYEGKTLVSNPSVMEIPPLYMDEFYELLGRLPQRYRNIQMKDKRQLLDIRVKSEEDFFLLTFRNWSLLKSGIRGRHHLYRMQDDTLYRYRFDEQGKCLELIDSLSEQQLYVRNEEFPDFYKYVLSEIRDYANMYGIAKYAYTLEPIGLELYGDIDELGRVYFQLDVLYEDERIPGFQNNQEYLPLKQEIVENFIRQYADIIQPEEHCALFHDVSETLLEFMRDGLPFLSGYCEIFVSDVLKNMNKKHVVNLQAGLRFAGNLLEIDLHSRDIQKEELLDVLRAYRRKKHFYRLKNGKLLNLKSDQLEELDTMMQEFHIEEAQLQQNCIQLPGYRLFMLDAFTKDSDHIAFHKEEVLQHVLDSFGSINAQDIEIPQRYRELLRDYQKDGFRWLKLMHRYGFGGILADDMGLGKTLQVIAFLESERQQGRTSIVVVPSSVLYNWEDEVRKFASDLEVCCITGSQAKREELIRSSMDMDLLITSYDYLKRDIAYYENRTFFYKILDEAQYIKNQRTMNATSTKRLKSHHALALTGTPIENSLAELWSIFDFLMPGYLFDYRFFSHHFEKEIVMEKHKEKQEQLKKMVQPFILRRVKKDVLQELPEKTETTLSIAFDEAEETMYMANLAQVNKELQQELDLVKTNRFQVLGMLMRLRQLCCDPRLVYDEVTQPSSKLKACMELVSSLVDNNKSVLLFSNFTSMLDLIQVELQHLHIPYFRMDGSTGKEDRRELVQKFQDKERKVFLISLKSGGTGINLTAAEAVIHYDPWWNVSAENQASDRAYRIGQNSSVQVYKLIMRNTVEERIQHLQQMKKELADIFVEENEANIMKMDKEQILELLKVNG